MLSRFSAISPSQRLPAWVSRETSVLTALLARSLMRWLKGLILASTRLIQPSTRTGEVHPDQVPPTLR